MTNVFVGNLSYQTTEREVRAAFERFGRVSAVRMVADRMTGKQRGIAFVSMPHFEDAEEAIVRLNGSSLGGRRVLVEEARDRAETPRHSIESGKRHRGLELV